MNLKILKRIESVPSRNESLNAASVAFFPDEQSKVLNQCRLPESLLTSGVCIERVHT